MSETKKIDLADAEELHDVGKRLDEAAKAAEKAEQAYIAALGVHRYVSERIAAKYGLGNGVRIDKDGTVVGT